MAEQTKERPNRTDGAKSMTTHDNDKAHDAAERELFEQWHRDTFNAEASDFEECNHFQDPVWMAYQAGGRSALTASEAKTAEFTDEQILAVLGKCAKREGGYTMIDFARALLASAPPSPPEAQQPFAALSAQSVSLDGKAGDL